MSGAPALFPRANALFLRVHSKNARLPSPVSCVCSALLCTLQNVPRAVLISALFSDIPTPTVRLESRAEPTRLDSGAEQSSAAHRPTRSVLLIPLCSPAAGRARALPSDCRAPLADCAVRSRQSSARHSTALRHKRSALPDGWRGAARHETSRVALL